MYALWAINAASFYPVTRTVRRLAKRAGIVNVEPQER
jgi:hypothetical protein